MSNASNYSTDCPPRRETGESSDLPRPATVRGLSDRQAVIAVMVANGRTCQDIALDLLLPLRTVQGHLQRALKVLALSSVEDLTYAAVTAHSSTNPVPVPRHTEALVASGHHGAERSEGNDTLGLPGPATGPPPTSYPGLPIAGSGQRLPVLPRAGETADAAGVAEHEPDENAVLRRELELTRALLQRQIDKVQQLHQAVVSRDTIGQAKGILMERHKISAERAFAMLQDQSSRTNRKLVQIAEQLVYSGGEKDPS